MTARLEGRVALITGAGSGMGRCAAELFAAEGARVVVSDVDEAGGNDTVAAVRAAGGDATFVRANVAEWSDCQAMVAKAVDTYGGLHVLYNNAGIFPADDGGVLDTQQETWRRVMAVNLEGVWLGCKAGIPALRRAGGGSIVNTASFVALMGAATPQIAYTASKGGVLAMTREIAIEYARRGIRANALCPGPVNTPLLQSLLANPAARARRLVHLPMGRLAEADEVAAAALFLASGDSSYVNGAAFLVDGGTSGAYVTAEDE